MDERRAGLKNAELSATFRAPASHLLRGGALRRQLRPWACRCSIRPLPLATPSHETPPFGLGLKPRRLHAKVAEAIERIPPPKTLARALAAAPGPIGAALAIEQLACARK